ncbi:MAG: DNA polymerase III subunit alpha [Lachnospiraceae bacterium]|nr:DNA polymerase III subunit alpha [Lachnospiraceae bacterium]
MAFTHLHVHTQYSLLDGSGKIGEMVARAKELGMDSMAITDHGVMYGVIEFYRACRAAGIRPILGCEVYVAPNSRLDREPGAAEERYHHLVLLAENNTGYANLMRLVSQGFIDGYYYRPRIDKELLRQYHEGIIALSACLAGEVPRWLQRGMYEEAKAAALEHLAIFGEGNYFLELQDHGIPEQKNVNTQLIRMSQETGIPLVCTNDIHYTLAEDAEAHDLLLCLQTGKKVSDENRMRYEGGQYYIKSEEEMRKLFPYAQEALDNTHRIAERCNVEIEFGVTKLPHFDVPEGFTSQTYLRYLCDQGIQERYQPVSETARKRLDYELNVIAEMGYVDYFLIVWDFIRYARENGIAVGPGRGSGAGSIVAYSLHITNVDPLKYDLLFERFLNPERVSMPDIDVDFCYERRGEVIDYVTRKYGADCVVQIVTFGTLQARGVVRDVGRVLDYPYAFCDKIAKMIPKDLDITLDKALERSREFADAYHSDPQIKKLVDYARRLEGLPRHASTHAAGVVICSRPAYEFVPLSRSADGQLTTQFTMTTIEELGLLKMDFLGLRTLTVIRDAQHFVKERTGKEIDFDTLPLDDPKVFDLIGSGRDEGIFQLESGGMKSFMKELKPHNIEDVIAGIALYRPGPMRFIPTYVRAKNGGTEVQYLTPQLKPILESTYGCIVYQEQVMQIVRDLGGYTLGRSDLVRRAMSKKKASVMEKERANFVYGNKEEGIPGCLANGIPENIANQIYDSMMDFAQYAFNKAHATCYAVVGYWTAYLKLYYPEEFMAALMTSVMDVTTKVAEYIGVCRQMGIKILPPDINESSYGFTPTGNGIRYGLTAIKGVGRSVADSIVAERQRSGEFVSLSDFLDRMMSREINKRTVENFIFAGAFDQLPGSRSQKIAVYADVLEKKQKAKKDKVDGQLSLFDFASPEDRRSGEVFPDIPEYSKADRLAFEKEVLGLYVSGHPLEEDEERLRRNVTARISDFNVDEESGEAGVIDGSTQIIGGIITKKTVKTTKNGKAMIILQLEDMTDSLEVLLFPKDAENYRDKVEEGTRVFIQGRVSLGEEVKGKLICEQVLPFDEIGRDLWILYQDPESYQEDERRLLKLLSGEPATVAIRSTRQIKKLPGVAGRELTDDVIRAVTETYGSDKIAVREKKVEDCLKKSYNSSHKFF